MRPLARVPPLSVLLPLLGLCLVPASACTRQVQRTVTAAEAIETLDARSPFLKAHLRNGGVYVLSDWQVDSARSSIRGAGVRLDVNRVEVDSGTFELPADSVALFETNVVEGSSANGALVMMTGITAAVAGICISNPKSCFGSCPTFYAAGRDGEPELQAEAFSASIAPALEATDVDMLLHARPGSRDFTVRVTNEALETHVIRHADLLAVPRPAGGRVHVTTEGAFRLAVRARPPSACAAAEGDCLPALRAVDGEERVSRADSADLAARETVDLVFEDAPPGELGLVVSSRQTLMTTFLVYQTLAYMGDEAGRWLAALERGAALRERAALLGGVLGGIDVLVEDAGVWRLAGRSGETGPIAVDTRVVPLGIEGPRDAGGAVRIRLRLTQGLWRLDAAQLVALGPAVEPVRIRPHAVTRAGSSDSTALAALLESDRTLVTLPGDAYELAYRLPPDPEGLELFLEARGYYLEWMRQEWLAEENPLLAARLLLDPAAALRDLAPAFKELEPTMEEAFWGSRYVRP